METELEKISKNLKFNQYEHGGSRIYYEDKKELNHKELLVDTFYTKHFAEYILNCVKDYFTENQNCICKDSSGWTDKPCCNICGKQVEGK